MTDVIPEKAGAQSVALIATAHASRYLQQLCKHFAHKLPVTYDASAGHIAFSMGECQLNARHGSLALSVAVPESRNIETLQKVVASHLIRFAFREEMQVNWHPA